MNPYTILLISVLLQLPVLLKPNLLSRLTIHPNVFIGCIFVIKLASVLLLKVVYQFYGYDLLGFAEHGNFILKGLIPAKDYSTPYSIMYEYLLFFCCKLYNDPLSIAIFFLACEAVVYLQIIRLIPAKSVHMVNTILFTIATNPLFLFFTIYDKQDEILLIVLAVSLLFWDRNSKYNFFYAFIAILFTKILALLILIPIFKFKYRQSVYLGLSIVAYFSLMYYSGFTKIFKFEFSRLSGLPDQIYEAITPGNFWFILNYSFGFSVKVFLPLATTITTLLLLNIYLFFMTQSTSKKFYLEALLCNFLLVMITYKMTFAYYHWIICIALFLYSLLYLNYSLLSRWIILVYSLSIAASGIITYSVLSAGPSISHKLSFLFTVYQLSIVCMTTLLFIFFVYRVDKNEDTVSLLA